MASRQLLFIQNYHLLFQEVKSRNSFLHVKTDDVYAEHYSTVLP